MFCSITTPLKTSRLTFTKEITYNTVESPLSGPPLSIIRHGNFSLKNFSKNGRVSSCYHGHRHVYLVRMRRRPACYELRGWIKAWFIHSIIWYIQLSSMALEQRCPDNRGYCTSSRASHITLYGGLKYTLSRFEVVGDSTELSSVQLRQLSSTRFN